MKIALFIAEYCGGGAERVLGCLAKELASHGHEVHFIIGYLPEPVPDMPASVRIINLNVAHIREGLPKLTAYLREQQPDILLATLVHSCCMAVLARLLSGAKTRVILREANTISADLAKYSPVKRTLLHAAVRMLYPKADAIIAISTGVAEDLRKILPACGHKIHLIYSPIISEEIPLKSSAPLDHPWFREKGLPVVISAGRLSRQKRFDVLIRAFARMRADKPAKLVILGEGELRGELTALIKELGLTQDVSLPGFDPNPFRYMARSDLFVLSSDWEGLPGALVQALSCGCPVISTDCPSGPRDILKMGALGKLVPMGDVDALALAMREALDGARAECPPEELERFTARCAAANYLGLMEAVLSGRPAGTGKRKLAYITAFIPYGRIESFVLEESCGIKEVHPDFLIVPRNPPKEMFHQRAQDLEPNALWLPLINAPIAASFLASLVRPRMWRLLVDIVQGSRNPAMALKNLAVVPKAVHVAGLLRMQGVGHVHAHWGSTTATMAYVIHYLTDIPYSFTLHRWDIFENNMLRPKIRDAAFARCISEKGKGDLLSLIGRDYEDKVHVIHMGVKLPESMSPGAQREQFIFLTPANLLPVKGHRYLIEACGLLAKSGRSFRCLIAGDGPLEGELRALVQAQGLADRIEFLGRLPHEKVTEMYAQSLVDAVILPSVDNGSGEAEGIPVALIEALSYGIPAIATRTGAIPELLDGGCGILVPDRDAQALAAGMEAFMRDRALYNNVRRCGREKVEEEFDLVKITVMLISLYGL